MLDECPAKFLAEMQHTAAAQRWAYWAKLGVLPESGGLNQQTASWEECTRLAMDQETICRAKLGIESLQ